MEGETTDTAARVAALHPRLDAVGGCPSATTYGVGQVFRRRFDRAFKDIHMNSSQFTMLSTIGWLGETSVGGLTKWVARDQTTLSRGLENLRDQGWVEMTPDPADRRIHQVRLTAEGCTQLEAAMDIWEQVCQDLVTAIGAAELETLLRLSRHALQALDAHDRAQGM